MKRDTFILSYISSFFYGVTKVLLIVIGTGVWNFGAAQAFSTYVPRRLALIRIWKSVAIQQKDIHMTIRTKALIIIGVSLLCMAGIIYATSLTTKS